MSRLLRLYPQAWRERYGEEFITLLADRPPRLRDSLDIARGALDARLHPQVRAERAPVDRRVAAPVASAVLLGVTWAIAANGPLQSDDYGTYRDGAAAMPFWLASMLLLAVGFLSTLDHLPAGDPVGRGAAVVAALAAGLWSFGPWVMAAATVMLVATVVLAMAGLRSGAWPRLTSAALAAVAGVPAGYLAWSLTQPWYVNRTAEPVLVAAMMLSVAAVWPLLALILARTPARASRSAVAVAEAAA